jgi:preprotein translocase subunit SecD
MKKIITTLTAVTFALGLAAAAQAQVAKTPEKPAAQAAQEVKPQVAPKPAAKPGEPVVKETVATGDKTKEATPAGDKSQAQKEAKQTAKKGPLHKKAGAPQEKTQGGAK